VNIDMWETTSILWKFSDRQWLRSRKNNGGWCGDTEPPLLFFHHSSAFYYWGPSGRAARRGY